MEFKAELELPIPQCTANLIVSGVELLEYINEHGRLGAEVIPLIEGAKSVAENCSDKIYHAFSMQVLNDISKNIYIIKEMVRIRLEKYGRTDV